MMPVSQGEQTGIFNKFLSGIFVTTVPRPQVLSAALIMNSCLTRNYTERLTEQMQKL